MTFSIKQVVLDPFGKGAYVLASDGTDSAVWSTPDVYAAVQVWTKGATKPGVYTILRTTNIPDAIFIYGPQVTLPPSDCAPFYYDLRIQLYDWAVEIGNWVSTEGVNGAWDGFEMQARIRLDCTAPLDPNSTITVAWYNQDLDTNGSRMQVQWYDSGMTLLRTEYSTGKPAGENSFTYSTNGITGAVTWKFQLVNTQNGHSIIIRTLEITNP